MEFSFSEDQNELRRAARRFLEVASSEERVRSAMETEQGYDSATWVQLSGELAWTALTIPEEYGGLGMNYMDLHPLMEEMGRALLCSPFFSTVCLGANALLLSGSDGQKEQFTWMKCDLLDSHFAKERILLTIDCVQVDGRVAMMIVVQQR